VTLTADAPVFYDASARRDTLRGSLVPGAPATDGEEGEGAEGGAPGSRRYRRLGCLPPPGLRARLDDDASPPPPRATAFVSYPRIGKHVAFDGRWLHGAPEALSAVSMSDEDVGVGKRRTSVSDDGDDDDRDPRRRRRRVTFLVNVWLDHVPTTAAPLPDDALREVSKEPYDDDDDDARAGEAPVDAYEVVEARASDEDERGGGPGAATTCEARVVFHPSIGFNI
jgi:hypothetical protein